MYIRLAETAGFCMGVRRAVNMVVQLAQSGPGPIYTLGPLVHNPQVIDMLKAKGVQVISMDDIARIDEGTVVIRAHGVKPDTLERLRQKGLNVIDATCPRVMRIQKIIGKHTAAGGSVIIVGDRGHAETTGLLGFAGPRGAVAEGPSDIDALPNMPNAIVVSQTTQDPANYQATIERIRERFGEVKVHNTICDSTHRRQIEVASLAKSVDALVIVGGKNSANTRRLAELALAAGTPAIHVEQAGEIDAQFLRGRNTIGLTAGASTPNWMIANILVHLHKLARGHRSAPIRWALNAAEWSVRLNLLTMLGGFCLTYACFRLQQIGVNWLACLTTAFYVLSMHSLNRQTVQRQALSGGMTRGLEPPSASRRLMAIGMAAMLGALAAAAGLGWAPLLVVAVMSAAGFVYRVPIVPKRFTRWPWRRLSDIPGSKDLFTAAAWAVLAVVVARLAVARGSEVALWTPAAGVAIFVVAVLVFVRSVLLDILDIQTDRIVGIETLPVFIGPGPTHAILASLLAAAGAALALGTWLGALPSPLGYAMLACVAWAFGYLYAYRRRWMHRDLGYQAAADLTFILAGLVAWIAG